MANNTNSHARDRVKFTRKMKKEYTILSPEMCPIHFGILKKVFLRQGFHVELMGNEGPEVIEQGLKYIHNDTCYPCILITGQMLDTIKSGKYDPDKVAMIITQSGGGCRDSNYINLMRKAFERAGYPNVPFISANFWFMETNSGINPSPFTMLMAFEGLLYGDMLMTLANQVRPYEVNKGETDALMQKWIEKLGDDFYHAKGFTLGKVKKTLRKIAAEFEAIPVKMEPKVKVAVLGELYLKFSAPGNNHLEEFLQEQDCEYFMPGTLGFGCFKCNGKLEDLKRYGGHPIQKLIMEIVMLVMNYFEKLMVDALKDYPRFVAPSTMKEMMRKMKEKEEKETLIDTANSMGEGWSMTAEMLEAADMGFPNVICCQPFGCLPCHVAVKGMLNKVRREDPRINAVAIEYDPGATKVNQENRIKLMLSVARENLAKELAEQK